MVLIWDKLNLLKICIKKYNRKCNWFLLFDFDEYLEIFFEKGKNLILKDFLTDKIYDKCEAILFNWVIYTDNDLLFYDNRPLIERFTTPNFQTFANMYVKSIVRGGLNKTIFLPNKSNHVPERKVKIFAIQRGKKLKFIILSQLIHLNMIMVILNILLQKQLKNFVIK